MAAMSARERHHRIEAKRERDGELGRLVRAVLALGGMVCRLDSDEGPVYVVEVYGDTPDSHAPILIQAEDPVVGLRAALAQVAGGSYAPPA